MNGLGIPRVDQHIRREELVHPARSKGRIYLRYPGSDVSDELGEGRARSKGQER